MFDHLDFVALLNRAESDTLDFKATDYDISQEGKRVDFVKDILCMANTPREQTAYVVLGVKKLPDGTNDLWGLTAHVDDADLQSIVREHAFPVPRFGYETALHEGKQFGIISIPIQHHGPFLPIGDHPTKHQVPKLRKNKLYFRRGSQNDVANHEEICRIYNWMQGVANSDTKSHT